MKLTSSLTIAVAVALGAAGTHAIALETLEFLGDNYTVVDTAWDVPFNATHSLAVNGTVEDVFHALHELDPVNYAAIHRNMANNSILAMPFLLNKRDNNTNNNNNNNNNDDDDDDDDNSNIANIAPRAPMALAPQAALYAASVQAANQFPHKPTVRFCRFRKNSRMASKLVWQGIYHLDAVPGIPRAGAGPGKCGMVSCSYNTGITWCNDNDHEFALQSYKEIAAAAAMIIRDCENWDHRVVGQQFFADNWNVIVHQARC